MNRTIVRSNINRNIGNISYERFNSGQVNEAIQKGYDLTTALTGCIQRSTSFPFPSDTPYINLRQALPDFFAVLGIYNLKTNRWLEPTTVKELNNSRWDWERWTGEPTSCFFILDFNRIGILPYQSEGSGTFVLWYLAKPGNLTDSSIIELPDQYVSMLEEYGSGDLFDIDREYTKALGWYGPYYEALPELERVINNMASFDKDLVLEPYFPMGRYGRGGAGGEDMFADNIVPGGVIDGENPSFSLPSSPNPSNSLLVMKNGQVMYQGVAYTLTGPIITFNFFYIPQDGDLVRVWYRTS